MKTPCSFVVHAFAASALAAVLSACGGGDDATSTAATTPGTLTISAASNASRNGSYKPTGAVFTSGADSGFNGNTADGKFEMEVLWSASATIKRAAVWFFMNAGTPSATITFFGCNGGTIPCTGVRYDPASKQVVFNKVAFVEVSDGLTASTRTAGGETLSIDGSVTAK